MSLYISFLAVLALSLITVTLQYWPVFKTKAHPPILSVSAGVGITYVFLTLLPKLAEVQASLDVSEEQAPLLPVGLHAYLGALAGFIVFLLIVRRDFEDSHHVVGERPTLGEVLTLGVFGLYYSQIGFLLGEWPSSNWFGYLALVTAFGMHFVGVNYHLWKRYPRRFPKVFRWVFCGCLVLGWVGAALAEELSGVVKLSTMFVAGGIIITAIREEIPPQKEAHLPSFIISVIATTLFILFAEIVLLK